MNQNQQPRGSWPENCSIIDDFSFAKSEVKMLEKLDLCIQENWREINQKSALIRAVMDGRVELSVYALYLIQTYHYTRHNARNQALVGVRAQTKDVRYLKFCFDHAAEETGHELMALHDLRSLDLGYAEANLPAPLPATEVLIAYLYWISVQGNPLQRLGYSYWAENSYAFIGPVLEKIRQLFSLKSSQMTFFIQHAQIDDRHAREVRELLLSSVHTDEDWQSIIRVADTTLKLTGRILDEVYASYCKTEGVIK